MNRISKLTTILLLSTAAFAELPKAKEQALIAAYQKAVASATSAKKDADAYFKLSADLVMEEKLPKGTTYQVAPGECKPIAGKNSVECEYTVTVVPPPAEPPAEKK